MLYALRKIQSSGSASREIQNPPAHPDPNTTHTRTPTMLISRIQFPLSLLWIFKQIIFARWKFQWIDVTAADATSAEPQSLEIKIKRNKGGKKRVGMLISFCLLFWLQLNWPVLQLGAHKMFINQSTSIMFRHPRWMAWSSAEGDEFMLMAARIMPINLLSAPRRLLANDC